MIRGRVPQQEHHTALRGGKNSMKTTLLLLFLSSWYYVFTDKSSNYVVHAEINPSVNDNKSYSSYTAEIGKRRTVKLIDHQKRKDDDKIILKNDVIRSLKVSDSCPNISIDDLFKATDVSEWVLDWFDIQDNTITNIVDEIVNIYFDEIVDIATGSEVRSTANSSDFEFIEVCSRLPLKNDDCYLAQDGNNSLIERLVAKFVPFGAEIIKAKESYEDFIQSVQDTREELNDYFSIENEEKGSCAVANTEMIGIAEFPGLPSELVYKVCNCVSVVKTGVPACTIQPYIRGFAMSISNSNALLFDTTRLGPFPTDEIMFYDGYVEYSLQVGFDVWLDFGLDMKIPKLFKPKKIQDLICSPANADPGAPKKNGHKYPTIRSKISMFIKNDLDSEGNEGEFVALMAVDTIKIDIKKKLELDMGAAYGALRIRSENPQCSPSGIFFGGMIKPQFTFGDELKEFLSLPQLTIDVKAGFTWLDDGSAEDESEYVQSVFFRAETEFNFLGITNTRMFELQYFDDKEFIRRRDFNESICCTGGQTNCDVPNSALEEFIQRDDVTPQPTLALFMGLENMRFKSGLAKFDSVKGEFIIQIADDDYVVRIRLFADVEVLYIVGVRLEILFELKGDDNWMASFEAELEVQVGVGTITTGVVASVAVGNYTESRRKTRSLNNSNSSAVSTTHYNRNALSTFLDADWNLDFYAFWETAQWVEDLGKAIVEGLKFLYEGVIEIWNDLTEAVEAAWDSIKDLAGQIGGAIANFFDSVSDGLRALGQDLEDGIDAIASFLDGSDPGPVEDIVGAVGDVFIGIIDVASDAFGAVDALFSGDFESFGKQLLDAFLSPFNSISDFEVQNLGKKDPYLNCPMFRNTWKECKKFIVNLKCNRKYSKEYVKEGCRERKLQLYEDFLDKEADGKRQLDCRRDNQNSSEGLKYAGNENTTEDELRDGLDVEMSDTYFNIGTISELSTGDGCKPMPFSVQVNSLSSTEAGFSNSRVTANGTSPTCLREQTQLEASLASLQSTVANKAVDAASQSQGTNDDSFKICSGTEDCMTPILEPQPNFNLTAAVFCTQDVANLAYRDLFGDVIPRVAERCAPRTPKFRTISSLPPLSCDSIGLQIKRSLRDCCGNEAAIIHTLHFIPVPPTITKEPGSMDTTLLCDADISPFILGFPTFEEGCPDAIIEEEVEDSDPVFDPSTCSTTIIRKFRIVENSCERFAQSFNQTITLENPYNPQWDSFPDDTTIGVFDKYGTEVLGFPTVYQRCGASPVNITYTDTIEEGSCFAERVLKRKFQAVDVCGHISERTQTITITNDANGLPLGEKSLAKVYGRYKAKIIFPDRNGYSYPKQCLLNSTDCGIREPILFNTTSMPLTTTPYHCGTGDKEEFSTYQFRLANLEDSLNLGPTKVSCRCDRGDPQCDSSSIFSNDTEVYFGTQVTFASGNCTVEEIMQSESNRGTSLLLEEKKNITFYDGKIKTIDVEKRILNGTDAVYNVFDIRASDFKNRTIEIITPPFSVVLVNVHWEDPYKYRSRNGEESSIANNPLEYYYDQKIYIQRYYTDGVVLSGEGMVPNNVLWNVVGNGTVNFKVPKYIHEDWSFAGTMINRRGKVDLGNGDIAWKGQLFCEYVKAYRAEFQCAHFNGFASCSDIELSDVPSAAPSVELSDVPSATPSVELSDVPSATPSEPYNETKRKSRYLRLTEEAK